MPKISETKEKKIKESILHLLFEQSPKALFTYHIARELARDEEYIKKLMLELESKNMILSVKKNSKGKDYNRRIRWRLAPQVYDAYKRLNSNLPTLKEENE
ncbi:MAG: hypothetical protein N3G19_00145 [Candidatus Pacearchaeota archaeon]|nr:hypothetical protein [Candidatus Pacearchaeota archaeon]